MSFLHLSPLLAMFGDLPPAALAALSAVGLVLAVLLACELLGMRYIPNNRVGIVEKYWSTSGSVSEGRIIALRGEAGFQADILRGGGHFGFWRWQFRIHQVQLVTVPQGKIGYVYARDGEPLGPSQTLGRVSECNKFQDARAFLGDGAAEGAFGQRGRQRAIIREGVYAINLALFVVMTEDVVYRLETQTGRELETLMKWQDELRGVDGFSPVVIGGAVEAADQLNPGKTISVDSIGIVTVHDGPSLPPGEIIAPAVGHDREKADYHNNYQDIEAFLRCGGHRGRQYVPLTDGTYFLNRWFASVEITAKTVVPIGYVGVIVSYFGKTGIDVTGDNFRHGERVGDGERGVRQVPFGPGKYPFNTYAGSIILVPTTNFVLHWITGRTETHRYDENLRSIEVVTKDAYEPLLPLSVIVHIDYQKAPSVIQRFGDVKRLITQTLDPMLSAYFRDIAHKKTMLELLQMRDEIQAEAREELSRRFNESDIECVDVLIGKPGTEQAGDKIETLLEQLRTRQLSIEQLETFERQRVAADKLRSLREAEAVAAKQGELTNSRVQVQITENQGEADLARARKQAEQMVVTAQADNQKRILQAEADLVRSRKQAEQTVVTAQAESQQRVLAGRGEGSRIMQIGLSEASVLLRKIGSFGDPRLYALAQVAEHLSHSTQPLVPERLFMSGGSNGNGHGDGAAQGMLGTLINLLVAEKSGFQATDSEGLSALREFADKMTKETLESMQQANQVPVLEQTATVSK